MQQTLGEFSGKIPRGPEALENQSSTELAFKGAQPPRQTSTDSGVNVSCARHTREHYTRP